jgi:hypothetical protein
VSPPSSRRTGRVIHQSGIARGQIGGNRVTEDRRHMLCAAVGEVIPAMQAHAAALDEQSGFPAEDFALLASAGLMIAPFPVRAGGLGLGSEASGIAWRRCFVCSGKAISRSAGYSRRTSMPSHCCPVTARKRNWRARHAMPQMDVCSVYGSPTPGILPCRPTRTAVYMAEKPSAPAPGMSAAHW